MGMAMLGVFVILAGAAIRAGAGTAGARKGNAKLAGYLAMGLGVVLAISSGIVVVNVGEVGVKHFLGRIEPEPLMQGVHLINPLASVEKMSIREQSFPIDGGVEQIEAQTSEQLNVALEIAILYRLDGSAAPSLYQRIGTEREIKNRIVLNSVRNGVRDALATKSINEIFSPDRREVATAMQVEIQAKAGDRIEVLDVFVRDVQAPARVRDAIEEKLQREQGVAAERFQTEIIQERARQAVEEAKGLAEAQRIISSGLTPEYLTFHYIQQLSEMGEGAVVYVPTEGGVPLIRTLEGGRR